MIDASPWHADLSGVEQSRLSASSSDSLPPTADVVVIGGGLVGLFTAWELVQKGVGDVILLEAGTLCGGASGKNTGGLFAGQASFMFPSTFRDLLLASRECYASLNLRPAFARARIGFKRNGSLNTEGPWPDSRADWAHSETKRGNTLQVVEGEDLRTFEPELGEVITGGLYCPDDATVHPLRTALAVRDALQRQGGRIFTHTPVEGLGTTASGSHSINTARGVLSAGHVVVTTGWEASTLAEKAGCAIPITAVKGQAVGTAPLPLKLRTNLLGEQMVRQLPGGEVIAGGTLEFTNPDLTPTGVGANEVITAACRAYPVLKPLDFVNTWVGLRPHTPDEMPVIDKLPGQDTLWIAAGHFTKGLLLAPLTGQLIAEWIVEGRPSRDLSLLAAGRFHN